MCTSNIAIVISYSFLLSKYCNYVLIKCMFTLPGQLNIASYIHPCRKCIKDLRPTDFQQLSNYLLIITKIIQISWNVGIHGYSIRYIFKFNHTVVTFPNESVTINLLSEYSSSLDTRSRADGTWPWRCLVGVKIWYNKNRSSKVSRKVFPAVFHSSEDQWLQPTCGKLKSSASDQGMSCTQTLSLFKKIH